MSALAHRFYTPEEYLELERAAPYKSEYYAGEIFAMAGASPAHNILVAGIIAALVFRLRGTPCTTLASDIKVAPSPASRFSYPDVTVFCGSPQFYDEHQDVLLNPMLIVEVLSPSTEAYDRGAKFAQYRRLDSLREYVLVSQTEARIEVFTRGAEATWVLSEAVGLDAMCSLPSLDIILPLSEIYERVEFAPDGPGADPNSP